MIFIILIPVWFVMNLILAVVSLWPPHWGHWKYLSVKKMHDVWKATEREYDATACRCPPLRGLLQLGHDPLCPQAKGKLQ